MHFRSLLAFSYGSWFNFKTKDILVSHRAGYDAMMMCPASMKKKEFLCYYHAVYAQYGIVESTTGNKLNIQPPFILNKIHDDCVFF